MKKAIASICTFLILSLNLSRGQSFITQVKPEGSKFWGYANQKGEMLIQPSFAKCWKFSEEGLALIYDVELKEFYFINTKGERLSTEVKGFRVKEGLGLNFNTEGFVNGMALIKYNGKWGFLNASGKLIIPAVYDDANYFNGGYSTAKKGSEFVVLNQNGEETKISGNPIDVNEFSEGLAPYRSATKQFGFIDVHGKIAIPAKFESVGFFHHGLAWAKADGGQLGYINNKGEWVIKPQFVAGKNFEEVSGLARVKVDDKWVFITAKGDFKKIVNGEDLTDFSEGLAYSRSNGKIGFYDNSGKWIIEPQFDAVRDFKNGFAAAKIGEKWGIINKQGEWVIRPTYDGIKDMELIK